LVEKRIFRGLNIEVKTGVAGLAAASASGLWPDESPSAKKITPPPPWFAGKSTETMLVYGGFDLYRFGEMGNYSPE
jgi:hypothetical protein